MTNFLFKDRDGQTPLPPELRKGLKHKHIQTIGELDEYEEDNIAEGLSWLEKQTRDCLTYDFWLLLHKKLFGNVWSWAGKVRLHELQNLDFLHPHEILSAFRPLEQDVRYWLDYSTYVNQELAARFHERLLTIHPFPNGNGRFSRILVEFFCKQNGIQIPTWGSHLRKGPQDRRKNYIDAIVKARKEFLFDSLTAFMFHKQQ